MTKAEHYKGDRSAALYLSITGYKPGKVTITGTASDGKTAECTVNVKGNMFFSIEAQKICNLLDEDITISGVVEIPENVSNPAKVLEQEIAAMSWQTEDEEIAEVEGCTYTCSEDHRRAELSIRILPHKRGQVRIGGTNSAGLTSYCQMEIQFEECYDTDYLTDVKKFLFASGNRNRLLYLCSDANFPSACYVAENDDSVLGTLDMALSDMLYRGLDGWRDLLSSSTSVRKAEQILASLLQDYETECKALATAKTAEKYAKMLSNAVKKYVRLKSMSDFIGSEEIRELEKASSSDRIERLLADEKYDFDLENMQEDNLLKCLFQDSNVSLNSEIYRKVESVIDSKELCDSLSEGIEIMGTGLKVLSITDHTYTRLYQLESILSADEMYLEMLAYIRDNCPYGVVSQAAGNIYRAARGTIEDQIQYMIPQLGADTVDFVAEETMDYAIKLAAKMCKWIELIKSGFDWGVNLSNWLYHIDDLQEQKDDMRVRVYIGHSIGRWVLQNMHEYYSSVGTDQETVCAKNLYYSGYMLWRTRLGAEESLQDTIKLVRGEFGLYYGVSRMVSNFLDTMRENLFRNYNSRNLLGIMIACPVDVRVCDPAGTLLLTLEDGQEAKGEKNGIYYCVEYHPVDEDYVKYIYYPQDKDYTLECIGKDIGLVDCEMIGCDAEGAAYRKGFDNVRVDQNVKISVTPSSAKGEGYQTVNTMTGEVTKSTFTEKKSETAPVESIRVAPSSCELAVGEKLLLAAELLPVNAAGRKAVWTSGNPLVATVNSDGVVQAVSEGTVTITVSSGKLSSSCMITVTKKTSADITAPGAGKGPSAGTSPETEAVPDKKKAASPKGTSLLKLTAKRGGFTASWKKQPKKINGYQLQYSTSKKFSGKASRIKTVKKKSVGKLSIKKLKPGKKYFVRIRTFRTIKGKKYHSDWSKIKSVVTKK